LLFFSFYKKQGIIDAVKSLAETVNTGFVAMSYLTSFVILLVHTISKKNGGMFDIDFSRIPGYINASLLVFFFMINISFTMTRMYGMIPLEQIIFHLSLAGTGANFSIVEKAIVIILFQTFVFQVISLYVLSAKINFEMRVWRGAVYVPFGKFRNFFVFFAAILPAAGFVYLVNTIGLPQYIETSIGNPSVFYEENYIFPARVKIDCPERKRNLIVIFVEGLETGYLTTENGGAFTEDLMPEVASLAKNNINFSGNGGIGGPVQLYGTEWTIAGIAAYYSGLPLAVRFLNLTGWNNYSTMGDEFMPGAYSMGDILYDSGYRSFYFLGSEIEFGGRDKYFKTHKNTVIYDYSYFKNNRYIPDGYGVWWGIEDRKLYELAKIKIAEISREEPFFITLLTADTHPADGYLDNEAERIFDSQFKNVIRDMSRQLSAFVEWLTEQDFYENTTIVILGDHLYQELSFFPDDFRIQKVSSKYENRYFTEDSTKSYNRYPINIFINSLFDSRNAKNRTFSHFDMLPVMIESIGGIFDSEGLALGRSLFKGSTLAEKYGEAEMNRQLRLKSELYDLFWRK
jgi:phosphoglycerol transferase